MAANHARSRRAAGSTIRPERLLDRDVFVRPVAHRGLHDAVAGVIENSGPAFERAIGKGYAIECDLQPARDATPMVFHDDRLDRLIPGETGPIAARLPDELCRMRYADRTAQILSFADFLALVAGRAPLLVEVKAEHGMPPAAFLDRIADAARAYKGPIALMSFNLDVVAALAHLAPRIPRGLVLGRQEVLHSWLARAGRAPEGTALSRILEGALGHVSFFAVGVNVLKGAAAWRKQGGHDIALFSWTVRSKAQRATAARYADAPIFEGYEA
ncbi:MAG: glycerophosphodiester phosphodiesterase family protein [Hyphomicrobiaceae bacterium]|nr:glycerophosphodiester phosphodiesterase family protein [Hyphomicrobiaceae bacterium]